MGYHGPGYDAPPPNYFVPRTATIDRDPPVYIQRTASCGGADGATDTALSATSYTTAVAVLSRESGVVSAGAWFSACPGAVGAAVASAREPATRG